MRVAPAPCDGGHTATVRPSTARQQPGLGGARHTPRDAPALALSIVLLVPAAPATARAALPLGPASLKESRTARTLAPGVRFTRIVRGGRGGGPWRVYVLEIDRARLAGRLGSVLAADRVRSLERPSSMARRRHAIAGVNGGYFAIGAPDLGDPVGVLAVGGRLVSEPVGNRTALLVPRSPADRVSVAPLRFRGAVTLRGQRRIVDGVDRLRGRIPACGGLGGDRPTELPNPFVTCTDASELIVLDRRFGARTGTTRSGVEVVVRDGAVTQVRRQPNTAIPPDGYVLSGTGDAARFLAAAQPGDRPLVDLALHDGSRTVEASDLESITGAGLACSAPGGSTSRRGRRRRRAWAGATRGPSPACAPTDTSCWWPSTDGDPAGAPGRRSASRRSSCARSAPATPWTSTTAARRR